MRLTRCPSRPFTSVKQSVHLNRHVVIRPRSIIVQASVSEIASQKEEETTQEVLAKVTRRIKALGAANKPRQAIQELAGLARLGIQPDTQAATALLSACSSDIELMENVFDELFSEFLAPDEVTFAVMVRAYGSLQEPDWAKIDSSLTKMRLTYEVEATATVFNALLEICVRTQDGERGQDVIDRMAADGVEPDEFTEEVIARRRVLRSYYRKVFG